MQRREWMQAVVAGVCPVVVLPGLSTSPAGPRHYLRNGQVRYRQRLDGAILDRDESGKVLSIKFVSPCGVSIDGKLLVYENGDVTWRT